MHRLSEQSHKSLVFRNQRKNSQPEICICVKVKFLTEVFKLNFALNHLDPLHLVSILLCSNCTRLVYRLLCFIAFINQTEHGSFVIQFFNSCFNQTEHVLLRFSFFNASFTQTENGSFAGWIVFNVGFSSYLFGLIVWAGVSIVS